MHPKLIEIGSFFLPSYGVMIALAFLAGIGITQRLAQRAGLDKEAVVNLAVYCALAGLAGAKLFMYVFDFGYYVQHPGEILSLASLQAGGVFQGGLIAALVVAVFYMRRKRLLVWPTADAFAPGIAAGHAIGRVGCFLAGCCWGSRCDLPWSVTFTNPDSGRLFGTPLNIPLHPSQLYESFSEALIFVVLYRAYQRQHRPGQIIGLYLVLYSVVRFVVEFFRFHEQALPFGGPFSLTQWISLVLFGYGMWLWLRARGKAALVS